jgi:hypothetical protein
VTVASITYWNRLEPRPRSPDLAQSLAARLRDPLWLLTRQWQMGELQGEDAGSPAFVRTVYRTTRFTGWQVDGGPRQAIDGTMPMEELVETEGFTGHLGLQVELGQVFESMLLEATLDGLIPLFRIAYPINAPTEAELAADPDREEARFQRVVGGRAIDGVALFTEARASTPALPPRLLTPPTEVPGPQRLQVAGLLADFLAFVGGTSGAPGRNDAPGWKPERLEYGVDAVADRPAGGEAVFLTDPGSDGDFDWYAFDLDRISDARPDGGDVPPAPADPTIKSAFPVHVRFRGMPNARWWDFETWATDFAAIEPDRRDLAKLLVMDFMLIAGNDWFVLPLQLPMGSLCQIDALLVRDVFGGTTLVPRADAEPDPGQRPWSMFSTAAGASLAPFCLMTPGAASAVQVGPTVEEVRFMRDEMANMVWSIEHTLEGGLGQGLDGQDRTQASGGLPTLPRTGGPVLQYLLETLVPENWIPMLPVSVNAATGDIALERAAMVRARPDGTLFPVLPRGRVLTPPGLNPYQVREEEVTRAGTRVKRVICRARWIDGSTHLWVARRKTVGAGEGSSGLKYDLAQQRTP